MSYDPNAPRPQKARGERFTLTESGTTAARAYLDSIVAARTVGGRRAFDEACESWAKQHLLSIVHGQLLSELLGAPMTKKELAEKVDGYGATATQIRDALTELRSAGLISSP
jgi:hypothetical protein